LNLFQLHHAFRLHLHLTSRRRHSEISLLYDLLSVRYLASAAYYIKPSFPSEPRFCLILCKSLCLIDLADNSGPKLVEQIFFPFFFDFHITNLAFLLFQRCWGSICFRHFLFNYNHYWSGRLDADQLLKRNGLWLINLSAFNCDYSAIEISCFFVLRVDGYMVWFYLARFIFI
jgi:hypothetical protein